MNCHNDSFKEEICTLSKWLIFWKRKRMSFFQDSRLRKPNFHWKLRRPFPPKNIEDEKILPIELRRPNFIANLNKLCVSFWNLNIKVNLQPASETICPKQEIIMASLNRFSMVSPISRAEREVNYPLFGGFFVAAAKKRWWSHPL